MRPSFAYQLQGIPVIFEEFQGRNPEGDITNPVTQANNQGFGVAHKMLSIKGVKKGILPAPRCSGSSGSMTQKLPSGAAHSELILSCEAPLQHLKNHLGPPCLTQNLLVMRPAVAASSSLCHAARSRSIPISSNELMSLMRGPRGMC